MIVYWDLTLASQQDLFTLDNFDVISGNAQVGRGGDERD